MSIVHQRDSSRSQCSVYTAKANLLFGGARDQQRVWTSINLEHHDILDAHDYYQTTSKGLRVLGNIRPAPRVTALFSRTRVQWADKTHLPWPSKLSAICRKPNSASPIDILRFLSISPLILLLPLYLPTSKLQENTYGYTMPEATSETNKATQNDQQQGQQQEQAQQQGGQQPVSFDLPEDSTQTALNKNDRTTVVDLQTGKEVPEPVARSQHAENLILCCLDPSKKPDRYDVGQRKVYGSPNPSECEMATTGSRQSGEGGCQAGR